MSLYNLEYNVLEIVNTYLYYSVIATVDSRTRRIWTKIKIIIRTQEIPAQVFPRRVKSKCPAIMLAVRQIANFLVTKYF